MIADVVPVTRIRRDVRSWTYQVPKGQRAEVGSLVSIPLRGRQVPGVVWATEAQGEAKETLSVITPYPLLLAPHRATVELMAEAGLCSLPTALLAWMPPALKRLPTRSVRADLQTPPSSATKQQLVLMPGNRPEGIQALQDRGHHVADTFQVRGLAAWKQWWAIRTGEVSVVTGRERGWFAPFVNLRHIHIVEPDDISFHTSQAPFLPLADLAAQLGQVWHSEVHYRSYLPQAAATKRWGDTTLGTSTTARYSWHTGGDLPEELLEAAQAGIPCRIITTHDTQVSDGEGRLKTLPGSETYTERIRSKLGTLPRHVQVGTRSILAGLPPQSVVWLPSLSLTEHASNPYDRLQGLADLGHVLSTPSLCILPKGSPALSEHIASGTLANLAIGEVSLLAGTLIALSHPDLSAHTALQKLPHDGWLLSHPRTITIRGEPTILTTLTSPDSPARISAPLRAGLVALPAPWKVAWQAWYGR